MKVRLSIKSNISNDEKIINLKKNRTIYMLLIRTGQLFMPNMIAKSLNNTTKISRF